jgi:hypothetical protein
MTGVPQVKRMERKDARRFAREVRLASWQLPDRRSRILGTVIPTWLLARTYRWLQESGRGEVWMATTPTAMAGVVALRRGNALEAVDFFSTGEMLGLTLAVELLKRVDGEGRTVILDAGGRLRASYFSRLGFEQVAGTRMMRRGSAAPLRR